ncbi:hypothetical protein V7087_04190 [Neobacillus niacini]
MVIQSNMTSKAISVVWEDTVKVFQKYSNYRKDITKPGVTGTIQ